jgi:drug/metabolite transporter (DMT)-like permease
MSKGYIIALAGVAFWSSTGVLIAYLTRTYPLAALQLAFWRDFFVALALLIIFALFAPSRLRQHPRTLPFYLVYGLILAVFNAIWTLSVSLNGAAVATVLAYGSAGFTVILAWFVFRESVDLPKIGAVILSLSGCVLVSNAHQAAAWQAGALPVLVGLLSGLAFAIYTLMGKETARRKLDSWVTLLYSFGFAAVFLFFINQIPGLPGVIPGAANLVPRLPLVAWLLILLLSVGPTILGYGLYTLSMHYLPAGIANLICTLEPSLTALQAYLLLGERLTTVQLLGSALVVAAVILVRVAEDFRGRALPAPPALKES